MRKLIILALATTMFAACGSQKPLTETQYAQSVRRDIPLEMSDPEERPAIKQCTDVTPYDTVYVGFPIWWGICPRIINSWLDNNLPQLEGKTMIPFATSGSSGIEEAEAYLKKTYPTLKWQKGMLMNKK